MKRRKVEQWDERKDIRPADDAFMSAAENEAITKEWEDQFKKKWMEQHTCVTCSRVFNWMDELRYHHCHKMEARPFVCDKCDASFTENYRLTRHRRTCKGAKPCPICPTCGKIFQFPSKLKEHGNGKRCKPDDHKVKETTCHDCGKEFPTPSKLQSHQKHSPGSCERHRRSQNPSASVCEECRKADFPSKMHVPGGKACKEYAKQNAEKTEKEE